MKSFILEAIPIISLLIAIFGFYHQFKLAPKKKLQQKKESLLAQFKSTQRLSIEVSTLLHKYAALTNSYDEHIFQVISFRTYIDQMESSREVNLSNKLYEEIKGMQIDNQDYYDSFLKILHTQYENLQLIHTEAKLKLEQVITR